VVVAPVVVVLDRIDDTVVPPASRALARVAERLGDTADEGLYRLRERAGSVVGPQTDADGVLVTPTGLRAAFRRDGLIIRGLRAGVIVTMGVIVVSAATATLQSPTTARLPTEPPVGPVVPGATGAAAPPTPTTVVGPYPGDVIEDYVASTTAQLASLAEAAPAAELHAVVSLTGYRTPEGLRALLPDFRLVRVFLRTPPDGAVVTAAVLDPAADVDAAFAAAAEQATRLVGTTSDDAVRDRAARDAEQFTDRCSCLYAVVVRAPAARLTELAGLDSVRLVDPAPPGSSPATTQFVPLTPERR
jgi:hypothetical protein